MKYLLTILVLAISLNPAVAASAAGPSLQDLYRAEQQKRLTAFDESPRECTKLKVGQWIKAFPESAQNLIYNTLTVSAVDAGRKHGVVVLDGGDECKGAIGGAEKDFGWTFAELLPSTNHLLTTIRFTAKREKIYRLLSVGPGYGSPDSYLPILLLEQMRVPYEVTFVEIDKAAAAGLGETLAEALKLLGDEKRCGFYEIVSLDFMTYKPKEQHDAVTLFNVTHFYEEAPAKAIMRHAFHVLSEQGYLFFLSDTNIVPLLGGFIPNRKDLEEVSKDIGLKIVRGSYMYSLRGTFLASGRLFPLGSMEKDTPELLAGIITKIFLMGKKMPREAAAAT